MKSAHEKVLVMPTVFQVRDALDSLAKLYTHIVTSQLWNQQKLEKLYMQLHEHMQSDEKQNSLSNQKRSFGSLLCEVSRCISSFHELVEYFQNLNC